MKYLILILTLGMIYLLLSPLAGTSYLPNAILAVAIASAGTMLFIVSCLLRKI